MKTGENPCAETIKLLYVVYNASRLLQSQKCGHPDTLGHFILSKFNVILSYKSGSPFPRNKQNLNLPLPAECNDFDWNDDVKEAIRLDEKSPVVFKPTQPDSPIGIDFDETRAVIGKIINLFSIYVTPYLSIGVICV